MSTWTVSPDQFLAGPKPPKGWDVSPDDFLAQGLDPGESLPLRTFPEEQASADPLNATMSPRKPGFIEQITAPIREGAIGRAFGISTETAEARKEDPSNPVLRFESALPNQNPGVVRGAAKFASGLTTPENALLMAGTGGLGKLATQIGKTGVSKLVSMGFSADMLWKAFEQSPQFAEQAKAGDWGAARETLTSIGLGTGMAALGLKHGMAADVKPVEATQRQIRDTQRPYAEPAPPGPPGPKMNREQRRATEPIARAQGEREDIIGKPRAQGFTGAQATMDPILKSIPAAKTAAKSTVPETTSTTQAQIGQLASGDRRAVMFPKGTPLQKRPAGMKSYQDADGNTYVYNPKLTSQPQIDAAISENRLPELLGATEGGMGAPDKTALAGKPVAVVGRTPEGVTTQATAADKASLPEAVRQTEKLTPPEGTVSVEPPQVEIAKRTEQASKPWEMSLDELSVAEKAAKDGDKNAAVEVFGARAPDYERAYRQAQGSGPRADEAQRVVDGMEGALSEAQRNRLYGIGETGPTASELLDYRRAVGGLDWESPQALGRSLQWAMTKVGRNPDPAQMTHEQRVAFASIRRAMQGATEEGWDTGEVSRSAMQSAAGRFSDPADADFMLEHFLEGARRKSPVAPRAEAVRSVDVQPERLALSAPESVAPQTKPSPFGSERGAISLKPVNQPTTPGEIYAKEMIAKREAAREGPISALRTRVKQAIAKAKAEAVDSTAPILDALKQAQKKHGYEVPPSANVEYNIDRALRATSIAEQFVKDHKLDRIIRDVEDVDYLDQYLIAKHAQNVERLKATPGGGSVTGRDAARDAALIAEFHGRQAMPGKTYDQVAQEVSAYSQKVLDYSVESGLVSKELATALKSMYPDYVPLNRVFSAMEQGAFTGPSTRAIASLSKQTIVQKLEGSSREIENPLWSMLDKTRKAFEQGERNKAAKQLAGYRDLPGFQGLIQEVPQGQGAPQNTTFTFLDKGVKRTFETTPEIAAAARSLNIKDIGLIGRIFAAPGRLMKIGTTGINLPFVASNIASDQLHTLVTSRYERSLANPGMFFKAFMAALPGRPGEGGKLWSEVVRQGAGFTSFDQYRGQPKSTIRSIRGAKDVGGAKDTLHYVAIEKPAQLFRQMEDIVSRSEEFGRARVYAQTKDALMKQGRTEADAKILATLEANNALPNYMRAGAMMRPLNAVIPYLNAGVQGSRSFLRSMERNPVKTAASVATTLYFPVAMATLWNLSDPARKKAYADIQDYEKDGNIVILMPGKPSKDKQNRYDVVKVKLPPGLNQLTLPLRRAIEAAAGLDPVKFGEVAQAAIGSVSPVEPNVRSIGSTLVPQALKPTVQAVANYDFFRGRPKVPGRLQELPPELQTTAHTSGTAKKIAGAMGVSPIKTEEFVKDTLGGIGSQVLNASDRALYRAGKIPASDIGGTSTAEAVVARFSKARGGETENREYELKKSMELDAERKAIAEARKTPYFMRLNGNEEMAQRYLNSVAARARNQVQQLTLSPRYRRMETEQKIAELRKLKLRLGGSATPIHLLRPVAPPIVPPSRRSRYGLSAPGPIE
jgi:hypothetical protein